VIVGVVAILTNSTGVAVLITANVVDKWVGWLLPTATLRRGVLGGAGVPPHCRSVGRHRLVAGGKVNDLGVHTITTSNNSPGGGVLTHRADGALHDGRARHLVEIAVGGGVLRSQVDNRAASSLGQGVDLGFRQLLLQL